MKNLSDKIYRENQDTRFMFNNFSPNNNNNNNNYYYYYIFVSFMQGSHTHIPGTNHVPRGHTVAAILSLLFMVPLCLVPALAVLFFYVSTF